LAETLRWRPGTARLRAAERSVAPLRYPTSSITSRDSEPSELRLWIVTWPSAPFRGPVPPLTATRKSEDDPAADPTAGTEPPSVRVTSAASFREREGGSLPPGWSAALTGRAPSPKAIWRSRGAQSRQVFPGLGGGKHGRKSPATGVRQGCDQRHRTVS